MKEYRIINQKSSFFVSKFDFRKLEELINQNAKDGFEVKNTFVVKTKGKLFKAKEEIVIIMEK